jgi:aspartyl-tRNA(Asn)/glutamyl-tRNA(Gln) amidotransferase subunit B
MIQRNGKTYYPTIGLEVHAELATETKMFCACKNDPDEIRPNVNTCPVCMAHPGTLPVPNKTAIESVVKVGLAINNGTENIANFSEFDRKNYFYPDIPKGYQISQYKYPIVSGGELGGVKITRIHLEEDTGSNKHTDGEELSGNFSLVDFNRAGVPLMELVTEPVIHDAETAMNFGKELQLLLRTLGVAHANMEKGEMRVELNISISDKPDVFGTKVEVKNINSFSVVGKAAAYEIDRMIALYEAGRQDEIVQETRGWNDQKQMTYSQRRKENSNDYRYFPDPDLAKMYLHDMFDLEKMKSALPELPWQKRARYANDYGIKAEDIESYVTDKTLGDYFESIASQLQNKELVKIASNYLTSDLLGLFAKNPELRYPSADNFAKLIQMNGDGKLNSRGVKDILAIIVEQDQDPEIVANEKGLIQQNDTGALEAVAQKILDANPEKIAEYKSGKEAMLMFFVGQIMKETKGSANPQLVQEILKKLMG